MSIDREEFIKEIDEHIEMLNGEIFNLEKNNNKKKDRIIDNFKREIRYDEQMRRYVLYIMSDEALSISNDDIKRLIKYNEYIKGQKVKRNNVLMEYFVGLLGDFLTFRDIKFIRRRMKKDSLPQLDNNSI